VPKFESDASTLVKLYSANWAIRGRFAKVSLNLYENVGAKGYKKGNIKKINIALFYQIYFKDSRILLCCSLSTPR